MRYEIISSEMVKGCELFKVRFLDGRIAYKHMGVTYESVADFAEQVEEYLKENGEL